MENKDFQIRIDSSPSFSSFNLLQFNNRIDQIIKTFNIQLNDFSDKPAEFGLLKLNNVNEIDEINRYPSYIHLAEKSKDFVVSKLIEGYQLTRPDFILSIQLGDSNNQMKVKSSIQVETEHAIQRGLTNTVKIANLWITMCYNNQSMIELVENAFHPNTCGLNVPCIGFSHWKYSIEIEKLIQQSKLNRTHFILFDDGKANSNMKHILLKRNCIEHELSISEVIRSPLTGHILERTIFDNDIPIVMLLLGGDRTTLVAICDNLKNGIPLVVVRDTGGIADIIVQLCRKLPPVDGLTEFWEKTYIEECIHELEIFCSDEEEEEEEEENDTQNYVHLLNEMKELIVIFDAIEHRGQLSDAIADAMLTTIRYRVDNYEKFFSPDIRAGELEWCLIWDKNDRAQQLLADRKQKTLVLTHDMQRYKNAIFPVVQKLLMEALYRNKVDFVRLLIKYGASIEMLTDEQLAIICTNTIHKDALCLKQSIVIESNPSTTNVKIDELKRYILTLYNGYLQEYLGYSVDQQTTDEYWHINKFQQLFHKQRRIQALYLWFIFMKRIDMGKYLCSKSRTQTIATLLTTQIYFKAMKKDIQNRDSLEKMAKKFDEHSRNIIDTCFAEDNALGLKLLNCRAVEFYNNSPLDVAQRANCYHFLASNTVQAYLKDKWYHHFDYRQQLFKISVPIWIFVASLILPLVPIAPIFLPSLYKNKKQMSDQFKLEYETPSICNLIVVNSLTSEKSKQIERKMPSIRQRIEWFYNAPVVHYYYNLLFFIVFLSLFSYVILENYHPLNVDHDQKISITELMLHICILGLLIDEIYQYFIQNRKHYNYIQNQWNSVDWAGISLYSLAFATRFSTNQLVFICSKILMSIDLIIWYTRVLYLFTAHKVLGPKLVMIYAMTKDALLMFSGFILVFLFGFSIASWSLMPHMDNDVIDHNQTNQTNRSSWSWPILRDVIDWGIWKVFGQIAEPFDSFVSEKDGPGTFIFIYAILFTVISNLLLLNVLVAMFNEKIERIQSQSNEYWRYQRFWLISEYEQKTMFPPPLNMLCYFIMIIKYVLRHFAFCEEIRDENESTPSIDVRHLDRKKTIAEIYWQQVFDADRINIKSSNETIKQTENYVYHEPLSEIFRKKVQLELSNNQIEDKGAQHLARVIRKATMLTILDISKNHIGHRGAHYLADALLNNRVLVQLNLSSNQIEDQGVEELTNAFINNKTLQSIDFSDNRLGYKATQYLAQAFRHDSILTRLCLRENQIGDQGCAYLADLLRTNTTIVKLDVGANEITCEGTQHLAEALSDNTTLTELNLSWNQIEDDGLRYLLQALRTNQTLMQLDVGSNKITSEACQYLSVAILNYAFVTTLNLSSNQIGSNGIQHLTEALQSNRINTITTLDLGSNQIEDVGIRCLSMALRQNRTLIKLNLSNNHISASGIQHFAQTLQYPIALAELDLSCNHIGTVGAQHLAISLLMNTSLSSLNLSSNRIGYDGVKYLGHVLWNNHTITRLDLSNNQIGDRGAKYLAKTLNTNESIRIIHLVNNQIEDQGALSLANSLKQNQTLTTINLSSNSIGDNGCYSLAQALVMSPYQTITNIDLSYNSIGNEGAQSLAHVLQYHTTLEILKLEGNRITAIGARYLSDDLQYTKLSVRNRVALANSAIYKAQQIINLFQTTKTNHSITLTSFDLVDEDTRLIAAALKFNITLTSLDLSRNKIGNQGVQRLSDVFRNNTTLVTLKLSENKIGDEGAQYLINAFQNNTTLNTLDLSLNKISQQGIQNVISTFLNHPMTLLLHGNQCDDKPNQQNEIDIDEDNEPDEDHRLPIVKSLIDVLQHDTTMITSLNFSGFIINHRNRTNLGHVLQNLTTLKRIKWEKNQSANDDALCYLCQIIQQNTNLEIVELQSNGFDNKQIQYLARALQTNQRQSLTKLNLCKNKIGVDGIQYLFHILQVNQLVSLDLSHNQINDEAIQSLADALQTNRTLTYLNLSSNRVTHYGIQQLAIALLNCQTLISLDLSHNRIQSQGVPYLVDLLRNTTLNTVDFSWNGLGNEGIQQLCVGLKHFNRSMSLNLSSNEINHEAAQDLSQILENNQLNLDGNYLGDEGITYLCHVLRYHRTNCRIDFGSNQIGDKGGQCLFKTIPFSVTNAFHLTVNLNENKINEQIKRQLIRMLRKSNSLIVFL